MRGERIERMRMRECGKREMKERTDRGEGGPDCVSLSRGRLREAER